MTLDQLALNLAEELETIAASGIGSGAWKYTGRGYGERSGWPGSSARGARRMNEHVSTFSSFQPVTWPYQYPARWDFHHRELVPPKALPWFYTCDPMYLLGWLARFGRENV